LLSRRHGAKDEFTCDNEEHVILISSTHPLFDVSHHFVLHIQQGGQDAASNPPPNSNSEDANDNASISNPPPDSNHEDANDNTGGTNDGSHHRGAFDDMSLSNETSLPPSRDRATPSDIKDDRFTVIDHISGNLRRNEKYLLRGEESP